MLSAAGINADASKNEETLLAEFQRAGFFVTECCECPVEWTATSSADLAVHMAPSVLRRVQFSYKPKHILLLSTELAPLIPLFREAGLGENLLLRDGNPIAIPAFNDPSATVQFRTDLSDALAKNPSGSISAPD